MNRKHFSRTAASALVAAGLLFAAVPSHAFRMIQNGAIGRVSAGAAVPCNAAGGFTHWANSAVPINWFHNQVNQGAGKAAALTAAMNSWTAVAAANHTLVYAGVTGAGFVTDGQNTLVWGAGGGCAGGCLAITALVLAAGQVITESDVLFNNAHPWTTNGANFDTQAVAAHELGHALGIHHTELFIAAPNQPTMNATYFGANGRTLQPDDIAALQCAEARY